MFFWKNWNPFLLYDGIQTSICTIDLTQLPYFFALFLFGVGDHAAVIITMVVAVPPMILLTILGLRAIPPEVIEAGRMSGCNNWQLMFKVLIPTARRDILIGVNQVIMVCFSMAVISAFIGANGF